MHNELGRVNFLRNTYAGALKQAGRSKALIRGKQEHSHIIRAGQEAGVLLASSLVEMYGKCGAVQQARHVFDSVTSPDAFTFTMMIVAYAENGYLQHAREILHSVDPPTVVCYNAMVAGYTKRGLMEEAEALFQRMSSPDMASWNTLISGYARNGYGSRALYTFRTVDLHGLQPNDITFIAVLQGCSSVLDVKAVHTRFRDDDNTSLQAKIGNALISEYGKWNALDEAADVFQQMPSKNVISWTALITAFTQNGRHKEALATFRSMNLEGEKPNEVTMIGVLQACANAGAVVEGRYVHSLLAAHHQPILKDVSVGNAMVTMYSKCGNLELAREAFEKMASRDVVSFNVMVAAYAQNGRPLEAIKFSKEMRVEGVQPNRISFTALLGACNHAGLLSEARLQLMSMIGDYGVEAGVEHFVCIADLLGRGGSISAAEELIDNMPFEPDYVAWTCLLDACRAHGDSTTAGRASQEMHLLKPSKSSPYVLLFNTHVIPDEVDEQLEL